MSFYYTCPPVAQTLILAKDARIVTQETKIIT